MFIADLIVCSTCFGHLYAHHQEQTIRSAIKIHLLHLVGILFPHIIDDARSKPHQIQRRIFYENGGEINFPNHLHKYCRRQ
jgi:hypothetical protein